MLVTFGIPFVLLFLIIIAHRYWSRTFIWIFSIVTWTISIILILGWGLTFINRLSYYQESQIPNLNYSADYSDVYSAIAGRPVFDQDTRELIDEARELALESWLLDKAAGSYSGWRFTWMFSSDGNEREAMADRAIADVMLQKGDWLYDWEIDSITEVFIDPKIESGIELAIISPFFLVSLYVVYRMVKMYRTDPKEPNESDRI